jgi:hypothetical protein
VISAAEAMDVLLHKYLRPPFAILAGAGISYAPPSSLPTVGSLMSAVISSPTVPLTARERSELVNALSPNWPHGVGYYHFLRFEQLLEVLQLTVDPQLATLVRALPPTAPNEYHFMLARLLQQGYAVLTTNFDCLIEQACAVLGVDCRVFATEEEYAAYDEGLRHPLFKLHGTFETSAGVSRLIARTEALRFQIQTAPFKWLAVQRLLSKRDLLVIGYSGCDDFDVMPAVQRAAGGRALCWMRHSSDEVHSVRQGVSGPQSLFTTTDGKLRWFFNRTFLSFAYQFGEITRRPASTVLVSGDTLPLLREVVGPPRFDRGLGEVAPSSVPENVLDGLESVRDEAARELLAGALLKAVGLYHPATKHMRRACAVAGTQASLIAARAHIWIAEMAMQRSRAHAWQVHAPRALAAAAQIPDLSWLDVRTLATMFPSGRLQHVTTTWLIRSSADPLVARVQRNTLSALAKLREIQFAAGRQDWLRANALLESFDEPREWLDPTVHAHLLYWSACLNSRADGEGKEPVDSGSSDFSILRAKELYEQWQDYEGWANASIFKAERALRFADPEDAYNNAAEAFMVSTVMSDDFDAAAALRIMAASSRLLHDRGRHQTGRVRLLLPLYEPQRILEAASVLAERERRWENLDDDGIGAAEDWLWFPEHDGVRAFPDHQ